MVENHYQRLRCPVTLDEFLPSWLCMQASYEDIKASCCKIDEEKTKKEDPSLMLPPLLEKLTENSEEVDICDAKITFTNDDLLLGETHHNRPQFMVGFMREQKISRILIDDGSGINILPIRTVKELGIPMDELCESHLMIQGFNQGGQRAIEAIKLEINMGDLYSSASMTWIHENKVVSSTYHQSLKYCEDGVEKKIEVKVDDVTPTKSVAKKFDVATSKAKVIVEKDQVLYDRNKINMASSSKKVTHILCYVPKATKVEYPSSELQGNVLGGLTLPVKRIDAINSFTKFIKGFVKSSNPNSLLNLTVPAKRTNDGFDPNAYELLAKAVYDPNEPSKLGKLLPEASNPTQKMMMEKGFRPKVVVHYLTVKRGARHVKQARRRFRPELVPLIETEVNKLIEAGFVCEVKYATWISSIVPVRKKNGQIRVCVDFRDLNNACPKDEFPLPITELMIDATTGYEAMSFMNGSSGYNQICMAPKDEELTAFRTPKGIYCYKVMPFGLKNAGATYQRAMQNIFDDMLHKNVECYVDDLVVKSRKKDDHLQDLRMVFEWLRRYQLRMNPLKCTFGVTSRKFLDFIVRHRGIEIDQTKVDAILKMLEPKDIHELKGLQAQERSVGALLAQGNNEGKENALYYLSRMMMPNELKYSPIEKLCLAFVFSIQKLKHYFQAHVVRLVSRVNPIKFVMSKPILSDRLARWYLQFQQFKIVYVPQKAVKGQALADFLADHPILDD
ncbi:uncharacterized protein [Nicotiana tomentosiformis]|uniref:uncharacterized protein n=1 Tax=Nicotiana tomentosiformis TaxID=4098 RepID=UPI00388C6AA8